MIDDGSKDNRSKAKEALLEWVRKKTSGYVIINFVFDYVFKFVLMNITKFRFYSSSEELR
jgi:hypothetical protein